MKIKLPLEKEIQNAILAWLSYQTNCFAFPVKQTGVYDPRKKIFRKSHNKFEINGVSDILGIWDCQPLAIEVKRKPNKPTLEQLSFLERFRANGGIAIVAYSIEDVTKAFLNIKTEKNYTSLIK